MSDPSGNPPDMPSVREEIERIDDELLSLLKLRMDLVELLGECGYEVVPYQPLRDSLFIGSKFLAQYRQCSCQILLSEP